MNGTSWPVQHKQTNSLMLKLLHRNRWSWVGVGIGCCTRATRDPVLSQRPSLSDDIVASHVATSTQEYNNVCWLLKWREIWWGGACTGGLIGNSFWCLARLQDNNVCLLKRRKLSIFVERLQTVKHIWVLLLQRWKHYLVPWEWSGSCNTGYLLLI